MYQRPDAPQSIGGVLDDGFRLYRASLSRVIVFTFLAALAGQIPNFMISTSAPVPDLTTTLMVALLVSMVLSMLFYGAAMGRMNAVVEQRDMSVGAALSLGAGRLLPLLVFMVLYIVIVIVGMVLLVVPGIIVSVSLMFGTYLVLLEGKGPIDAVSGSHRLVWGHWWRTLVIISVASIVAMAIYLLVVFVLGFALAFGSSDGGASMMRLVDLVVVPVLGAVVMPLFYAVTLATYHDLKLRRTGTDLEQRLGMPAEA